MIAVNAVPTTDTALLDVLAARSIPFVILGDATGHHWLEQLHEAPLFRRPFAAFQIAECLACWAARITGTTDQVRAFPGTA